MKRMLLPVILPIILFTNMIYAQSLNWVADGGGEESDVCKKVAIDNDGHLIVGLFFSDSLTLGGEDFISAEGGVDCLIVKYDGQGEIIWAHHLGGSGYIFAQSLAVDGNNNIYLIGNVIGEADLDPGSGELMINSVSSQNTFIAKYTTDGNIVWGHLLESTEHGYAYDIVVSETAVYIGAQSRGAIDFDFSTSEHIVVPDRAYIAKYSLDAELIWVISYEADSPDAIALDSEENIYVTGVISHITDLDPDPSSSDSVGHIGGRDIYLAKYDSSGNYKWGHSTGNNNNDVPDGIAVDNNGKIAITGEFVHTVDFDFGPGVSEITSSGFGCFIAVYDSSGAFVWVNKVDNDGDSGYEHGVDVDFDMDGNLYLTSVSGSNELVFYNSTDTIVSPNLYNKRRAIIVKYNHTNYSFNYVFDIVSDDIVLVYDILIDQKSHLNLAGTYRSTVKLDPEGDNSLTSRGDSDFFIAKYNDTNTAPEVPLRSAGIVFTALLFIGAIIIRRVG